MDIVVAPYAAASRVASSTRRRRQSNDLVIWGLTFTACICFLAFPIVSFALALGLLLNLPIQTSRSQRNILAFVAVFSVCLMMSSRPLGDSSEDIFGYHQIYEAVADGDLTAFFQFGGGLEIALTSLFYLWGALLPPLTVNGLMLCTSMTASFLFVLWIEKSFYSGKPAPLQGPVLMGAAILLFNLYFSTQLVRQFLSLVILLYAFTASSSFKKIIYLAVATAFHLTALPFYALYFIARRGKIGVLVILLVVALLRIYFGQILSLFDDLPDALSNKLLYYVDNSEEYTGADLGSFRLIALLCLISIASLCAGRLSLNATQRPWHAIPWITLLVHYLLLPIPLASLRTTIMVHSVVTGLIAFKMFAKKQHVLMLVVFNVLLLYKIIGYATLEGSAGLVSTFSALSLALK